MMARNTPKALALVITAIKKMESRVGPNPREILNYISSVCDIPEAVAKRQVLAALKRGTMQGILQETDGHYSIPCRGNDLGAVAMQELGLLNLACTKRKRQQRKKKAVSHCGSKGMKKKSTKRGRSRGKSSKRKKRSMKSSSCGSSGRRKRKSKSKKRKSRSKYDCGTKKSKKSKRSKRKKSKKGRKDCVCPDKKNVQRSDTKSDGCPIKSEKEKKKESNKCIIDFDDMTSRHRKLSKTRSQGQSRSHSRGHSRSRSSMYY